MSCPNCNAPLEDGAIFCGNCGRKVTPQHAQGVTVAEATEYHPQQSFAYQRPQPSYVPETLRATPPRQSPPPQQPSPYTYTPPQPQGQMDSTLPTVPKQGSRRTVFLVATLVMLVLVSSATLIALLQNLGGKKDVTSVATTTSKGAVNAPFALAFFSDSPQGLSDTVKITTVNLGAPPAGFQYNAWLLSDANGEQVTALGKMQSKDKDFEVSYTDSKHANLFGVGNQLTITQEKVGSENVIAGKKILTITMPQKAFIHVRHLLMSFATTPNKIALMVGLREQARTLVALANSLKTSSDQGNTIAVKCYAQGIINLVDGTKGANTTKLGLECNAVNGANAGDGQGLLGNTGYIKLTRDHAGFAAQASDSTKTVQVHSGHVQICMDNIKGWLTELEADTLQLLKNPKDTNQVKEIVHRADLALNGTNLDNDETIDPVNGEGGVNTAYSHAQLMAQLNLSEAKPQ